MNFLITKVLLIFSDLIDCSYECKSDTDCQNWQWNAQSRECFLINTDSDSSNARHNYHGKKVAE